MTDQTARTARPSRALAPFRAGLGRSLTSTRIALSSPSEILSVVVPIVIFVAVLLFMQNSTFDGAAVGLGAMSFPSIIAMSVLFSAVMGITGLLAMDRTNGTLLRTKSIPGGTTGYLVGEIVANAIVTVVSALVILAVGLIVFPELQFDTPGRWLTFAAVLVVGLVSVLAIGAVIGALVNNPKNMGLVMLPMVGLIGVSGIFYPLVALPMWLQAVAQAFPLYWFGLGLRSSLLPESMAAVEVAGSWRLELVFLVLAAWALVALALAPRLLRRMARRESGSSLAARRRSVQQEWGV